MDTFGFTLLPAAAEARLDTITLSRNVPLFRRSVDRHDTAVAVIPCSRPDRLVQGDLIMLLTRRRLVVTRHTRLLDRVLPYLAADLTELSRVTWKPRTRMSVLDLRFQHADRDYQFWLRTCYSGQLDRLAAAFQRAFAPAPVAATPPVVPPAQPGPPRLRLVVS